MQKRGHVELNQSEGRYGKEAMWAPSKLLLVGVRVPMLPDCTRYFPKWKDRDSGWIWVYIDDFILHKHTFHHRVANKSETMPSKHLKKETICFHVGLSDFFCSVVCMFYQFLIWAKFESINPDWLKTWLQQPIQIESNLESHEYKALYNSLATQSERFA